MDNKEVKTNVNGTETTTVVAEKTPKEINPIVFIMFAEFLGYESPLINWAEKICSGVTAPKFVEKILSMEAITILTEMKKEYTTIEIRNWYDQFYPLVLEQYELKIIEKEMNDLPF
jgi:hypothetical protein